MSFTRTGRLVLGLALPLLCSAASFAQAPAAPLKDGAGLTTHSPAAIVTAPPLGYRWRTLVLQHAVPSDILQMMRWDSTAVPSAALPAGVRRVFALQSNNSLLLQATDDGYAKVVKIVGRWDVAGHDIAPRDVRVEMMLVAVPEARAGFYTPDMSASRLLPLLLANGARTVSVPTLTITNGAAAALSLVYNPPPVNPLRLVQADKTGAALPVKAQIVPRINADGTVTLGLTLAGRAPSAGSRTARAGESVVYDVSGPLGARGERVFLFAKPTITDSVTVTP